MHWLKHVRTHTYDTTGRSGVCILYDVLKIKKEVRWMYARACYDNIMKRTSTMSIANRKRNETGGERRGTGVGEARPLARR